jgi:signal transduction histidine kinase
MAADPKTPPPDAEATLSLAHALRTPLTSLSLGLGLLDEGMVGALSDAQREIVRALISDVARLSLLVDRTLQTDRLGAYAGPIERAPIDLGELVRSAGAPIVEQAREKGIRVVSALPSGITVVADPVKIGWVTSSLMGNALRYSPAGSTIEVRLRDAEQAELQISDQGPGVPPDARDRIFDRVGGRGLFLAREIVEAHGGDIRISTELGRGCTFIVTLPVARARGW